MLVINFHFHFPQAAHLVDIVHCSLLDFQLQKRLHSKARGLIKINLGSLNAVLDNQPYTWTDWECSNGNRLIKDGFKWAQIDQRWVQIGPNWSHGNSMGPMCVRWVQMSLSWSKVDFRDVWLYFWIVFYVALVFLDGCLHVVTRLGDVGDVRNSSCHLIRASKCIPQTSNGKQ